jgi:type I restriction enzyme, S subunit
MSKKVKKQKTMEELLEEEIVSMKEQPYKLPENWVWTRLNIVCNYIQRGRSPKYDDDSRQIPVISQKCIQWSGFDLNKARYIDPTTIEKYQPERFVKQGDILWNSTGTGTIGRLIIYNEDNLIFQKVVVDTHVTIVRANRKCVNPNFLYYFLISPYVQNGLERMVSGTTNQLELSTSSIKQSLLPLPPMEVQIKTANKLKHLLNKIDKAKQLIEEAKETFELRRAAILDKAFRGELTAKWREDWPNENINSNSTEQYEDASLINIPNGWKWVKLSDIIQVNPPKIKLREIPEDQICSFLPMSGVSDILGKITQLQEREYSKVKKGYTFFLNKDILFAKITPCMENGKTAIADNLINGFGFGSTEFHVLRAREEVNEKLIYHLVRSKKFRFEAKNAMTGAVGQQRVPKKFIEDYSFPLPPKSEQDEIVRILNTTLKSEEKVNELLSLEGSIKMLKQSILSKAFRGELGTNDPTEESAIELLKEVLQKQLT